MIMLYNYFLNSYTLDHTCFRSYKALVGKPYLASRYIMPWWNIVNNKSARILFRKNHWHKKKNPLKKIRGNSKFLNHYQVVYRGRQIVNNSFIFLWNVENNKCQNTWLRLHVRSFNNPSSHKKLQYFPFLGHFLFHL